MIESGSSLGMYMDCPRKYEYAYMKRLEQPGYSAALGFGSLMHAHVEEFTSGKIGVVSRTLVEMMARHDTQHHERIKHDGELAEKILPLWKERWEKDHPFANDKLEFTHSELEWKMKITPPGFPEEIIHVGKSDGVARHKGYNKLFLYELKTAADRERDSYVHRLEIDRQISVNIMALADMGIEVAGVIYDVVWKPGLRLKKEETQAELNDRIVATIAESPEEYFDRYFVYRNEKAIGEQIQDLAAQFNHLALSKNSKNFYRNTGACDNYGRLCPYFQICMEGKTELEQVYRVRDRKLPELSKEIQLEHPEHSENKRPIILLS